MESLYTSVSISLVIPVAIITVTSYGEKHRNALFPGTASIRNLDEKVALTTYHSLMRLVGRFLIFMCLGVS